MPVCFVLRQRKITFALWNGKAANVKFALGCLAQQPPVIPACQLSWASASFSLALCEKTEPSWWVVCLSHVAF